VPTGQLILIGSTFTIVPAIAGKGFQNTQHTNANAIKCAISNFALKDVFIFSFLSKICYKSSYFFGNLKGT
jgi:hypothetical protein